MHDLIITYMQSCVFFTNNHVQELREKFIKICIVQLSTNKLACHATKPSSIGI